MTWNDAEENSRAHVSQDTDELIVKTLINYFRNLDIALNLNIKTNEQYRDEAVLQIAAAKERLAVL